MASPGADAGDPREPALTVAAVARRLGVAPATLRTWDRRYGLGPSGHTAGAHRRYTSVDLERLRHMRRMTLDGVAPAEAARVAVSGGATSPYPAAARGGGGRVVALPDATPAVRGLARAALALDSAACLQIVEACLDRDGVVATWDRLLVPVLVGVGDRWSVTGQGIDVEHLLAECVMAAMRGVTARCRSPRNARPVLLCAAPEEQHVLPAHVLAAALAERGVGTRLLGSRVPREALVAAIRRSGPSAVFIWSQVPDTADPDLLRELPVLRPAALLVVGGPGWDGVVGATLAADVVATCLAHAVEVLHRASGG